MKYEMKEETVKKLMELLSRVNLQGKEVPAFNDVINCLNTPLKEEVKNDKEE